MCDAGPDCRIRWRLLQQTTTITGARTAAMKHRLCSFGSTHRHQTTEESIPSLSNLSVALSLKPFRCATLGRTGVYDGVFFSKPPPSPASEPPT
ncbi:hypothetical protein Hanom_Chr10g00942521 [Helianthus anomalus]